MFQIGGLYSCLRADVAVLEFNPRILSNIAILLIRKLIRRKTILWGHAFSLEKRITYQRKCRLWLLSQADGIMVYTEQQSKILKDLYSITSTPIFNSTVIAASCASLQLSERKSRKDFIYCGRLVKEKKPDLFVDAAIQLLGDYSLSTFYIVGDGPLYEVLKQKIKSAGLDRRIVLLGTITDNHKLSKIYDECIFSLSPGYVGLACTQSFSFGVPMLISKNEPHAPELEACKEGFNCEFFETNNPHDLVEKMRLGLKHPCKYSPQEIRDDCLSRYSVEKMVDQMSSLISTLNTK